MEGGFEQEMRYEAPKVLEFLRGPSAFLRGQYSTNFADVVSQEVEVQETYKNGLVALSSFIGGFVVIWGLVLVFFMLKGKAVGCASGRAFEIAAVDENSQKGSSPSANASEDDTRSVKEEEEIGLETASFSSSICSSDAASRLESATATSYDVYTVDRDATPRSEGPRALRTRIVFFLFACAVLACVPLALAFSFAPMKETAKSFEGRFDEVDDVILQVRAALSTISTASQSAMGILSQTSTNSSTFCPNINNTQFNRHLGGNLLRLSKVLSVEYVSLQNSISQNMTKIEDILDTVEDASDLMEVSFGRAESVIWFVPGLLLAVSIVTALATFGVILACKQEIGLRMQRCMSYGVLPALTALCLLCWILGIATTVTTAMSADFCLSGTSSGTPDATIQNMLLAHGDLPNTTKHKFIGAYTSGCGGSEPALMIVELERDSQHKVDEIWAHISSIDSFGRSALSEECGGSGLDELLSASRNIAKLLTKVRRALDSASDSLVCERIDPLYTATIHNTICTDFAEASAWGAITFCLLGISMMVLITLRASWRLRIDEDKIYHDEDEVAENMVVDEHEEYLRYISKYRHEWQEYNGFGSTSMKKSTSFSASGEEGLEDDFDSQSGSVSLASASGSSTRHGEDDGTTSIDSGEISFPSLDVPPTDDSSADQSGGVPMPPPILMDRRRTRPYEAIQNQEVMLCPERLSRLPGGEMEREEEKTEVELETMDKNNDDMSTNTEDSTDFSSIGKNAGRGSAALYWKNQMALGIENMLSVTTDSLVVSPNSDGGLTSFDLTKTPSPKKAAKTSFEHLTEKIPTARNNSKQHNPYTRRSSNRHETNKILSDSELEEDPYPPSSLSISGRPAAVENSEKTSLGSSKQKAIGLPPSQRNSLTVQTGYHSLPPPPPPPPPPPTPPPVRRSSSSRSRSSSIAKEREEGRSNKAVVSHLGTGSTTKVKEGHSTTQTFESDPDAEKQTIQSPSMRRSFDQRTDPPPRVRSKLMDLMHKFDPTSVITPEDLQTI